LESKVGWLVSGCGSPREGTGQASSQQPGPALDLLSGNDHVAGAFDDWPVLQPHRLTFLGVGPSQATGFDRDQIRTLGISVTTQDELSVSWDGFEPHLGSGDSSSRGFW
jgi:hypothetical protein